jgi:uncharacterized integral membrane protein
VDDGSAERRSALDRAGLAGRSGKFWLVVALVVVGFVLVLQNSGTAEVNILWFDVRMPLVFLLLLMVLIGVALDRVWLSRQRRR